MTIVSKSERTAWVSILLATVLFVIAAFNWSIDDRLLNGVSLWDKPMKFNVSFALHLATMLFAALLVSVEKRKGWLLAGVFSAASIAVLVELLYVFLQAARGRASHFNFDTPLEKFLYFQIMGGAAFLLIAVTIVLGIAVLLWPRPNVGAGLRAGAGLGLIVGSIATLITAGAMASGDVTSTGHWVGGDLSDANGLPLFGWSTTGGDLRVPHFVATHIMQGLPLAGWLVDRWGFKRPWLWVTAILTLALLIVIATFAQAISGQPLIPAAWLGLAA